MKARALVLCACLTGVGAPLGAQSIFNSAGIGMPMEALDGRARALASFGIGLQGPSVLPADPAAAARIPLPTGVLVAQPSWVDLSEAGTSDHTYFQGTRFPLLALAYPAFQGTFSVHIASAFDQTYEGERLSDVVLGGGTVTARDRFIQDGSLSSISGGYARLLDARTAVGISLGRYTGSVRRSLIREYGDSASIGTVEPYLSSGTWRYSGWSVTGGASTEFAGAVRVAASATWSTDLDASASGSTDGGDRSYSVPLQLRLGASSQLTPGLALSASVVRADWSATADDVGGSVEAGTVFGFGVGAELQRTRLFGRGAPLRLGFRRAGLPFSLGGGEATEEVFTGGLALIFGEAEGVQLASADLGLERGRRSGGDVTENFWRATVSVRLSTF